MRIIDTHCHLDDDKLYSIAKDVVERAKAAGVTYLFNTADSLPSFERVLMLEEDFKGTCYSVLGIHPEFALENDDYFLTAYKEREERKDQIKPSVKSDWITIIPKMKLLSANRNRDSSNRFG